MNLDDVFFSYLSLPRDSTVSRLWSLHPLHSRLQGARSGDFAPGTVLNVSCSPCSCFRRLPRRRGEEPGSRLPLLSAEPGAVGATQGKCHRAVSYKGLSQGQSGGWAAGLLAGNSGAGRGTHHLLVQKCLYAERLTETTEREPNSSSGRSLLPWSSGSKRLGFPVGASGDIGVGGGPTALPRARRSVTYCSPLSLPVALSFLFLSSPNPDGHHLTPHSLPDWRWYIRSL